MYIINENLSVPENEISFSFSTSSKPGGQNVNKVSTRATLLFDVANSAALTDRQREMILANLSTRINKNGILRVSSQKHRSQSENRRAAEERFVSLVAEAVRPRPKRKRTRKPASVRRKRLEAKRHRSRVKKLRARPKPPDEE